MDLYYILVILAVHWLADFVKQTDEMAKGKSSSNFILGDHAFTYSCWMMISWFLLWDISLKHVFLWVFVNGLLHFGVDYVTSRITSKLYKKGDIHNFFVVVGLDQFIHTACLLVTFKYMVL